jgi:hypothetical protein
LIKTIDRNYLWRSKLAKISKLSYDPAAKRAVAKKMHYGCFGNYNKDEN